MATKQQNYDQAIKTLQDHHVRITPQRQIILKYLINHHNHPSVETIYKELEKEFSNLSVATIYNNLKLFEKFNIIIALPNNDGGVRYDFFGTPHFHAICENCGRIFDIEYSKYAQLNQELAKLAKQQENFQMRSSKIEIYGICQQCQKAGNSI